MTSPLVLVLATRELTPITALVFIGVGIAGIVIGIFGKHFYAATGLDATHSGKEVERWKGRLLYVGCGIVFLVAGLQYFAAHH